MIRQNRKYKNLTFTFDEWERIEALSAECKMKTASYIKQLPFYGIHSFRHFAASSLISAGLDVTTISGALGHCNSGTTLNVYSHMFQTAQAKVAEAMDSAFGFLPKGK